jgi:hypothetical protein
LSDRNHQIILIIVGLITFFVGISLYYTSVESLIRLLVTVTGLSLLVSGLRYKARKDTKVLTGEERKAYLMSASFITTIIGLVVFFSGLGLALIIPRMALWFMFAAFVGVLLTFAGWIIKIADRK